MISKASVCVFTGLLPIFALSPMAGFAEESKDPALLAQPVLKHRVAVVSTGPAATNRVGWAHVRFESWKRYLTPEGVTLSVDDWATAVDLTRTVVGKEEGFRLVSSAPVAGKGRSGELCLLSRYGVGKDGYKAFFWLADTQTGQIVASSSKAGLTLEAAILHATDDLARAMALRAWRARVTGVNGDRVVIDRGYDDGLRQDMQFVGYSMQAIPEEAAGKSLEELMLLYGTKSGRFKVVEAKQDFATVKPVDGAIPAVSVGDILELPEVALKDRARDSRRKRVWDTVYDGDGR